MTLSLCYIYHTHLNACIHYGAPTSTTITNNNTYTTRSTITIFFPLLSLSFSLSLRFLISCGTALQNVPHVCHLQHFLVFSTVCFWFTFLVQSGKLYSYIKSPFTCLPLLSSNHSDTLAAEASCRVIYK